MSNSRNKHTNIYDDDGVLMSFVSRYLKDQSEERIDSSCRQYHVQVSWREDFNSTLEVTSISPRLAERSAKLELKASGKTGWNMVYANLIEE